LLASLGVDYAQGHITGKPVPLDTALESFTDLLQSSAG
jgi:EAL domain-containing protein (putative c-di-GMP-specific phosphodiesterase class I)